MNEARDDVDPTDRGPEADPHPGEDLPDPPVTHVEVDADEADVVEQSVVVGDESEEYPRE